MQKVTKALAGLAIAGTTTVGPSVGGDVAHAHGSEPCGQSCSGGQAQLNDWLAQQCVAYPAAPWSFDFIVATYGHGHHERFTMVRHSYWQVYGEYYARYRVYQWYAADNQGAWPGNDVGLSNAVNCGK